jgi:parallel beta-helix repeat protein
VSLAALLGGCGGQPAGGAAQPLLPDWLAEARAPPTAVPTPIAMPAVAGGCADLPAEGTADPISAPDSAAADDEREPERRPDDVSREDKAMPLDYDSTTNTIWLGKGAPTTLRALGEALRRPELLRELAPGEWLLSANLRVGKGALLQVAAPEAHRLKLRSEPAGFVWIKAFGGQLIFADTCATSWDTGRNAVDELLEDGRSFVLARDQAQMDIRGSELSYLGYLANESYGVAWRQRGTSGVAIDSRFGHNFYGLYSYEASELVIRGNEVHHSVRYGIDPHTRSNRLLIADNVSHHNGKQGIILAEACEQGVVRGNTVFANALHGIVLYQRSNDNLVENNVVFGNGLQGINVNASSHNTIRGNTAYDNAEAGIGVGQDAADNLIVGNIVRDNRKDGITFYSDAARNTVRANVVSGNARYGIYVKSAGNAIGDGNQVFGNAVGIYLNAPQPPDISLETNQVYDNSQANIRTGG